MSVFLVFGVHDDKILLRTAKVLVSVHASELTPSNPEVYTTCVFLEKMKCLLTYLNLLYNQCILNIVNFFWQLNQLENIPSL